MRVSITYLEFDSFFDSIFCARWKEVIQILWVSLGDWESTTALKRRTGIA